MRTGRREERRRQFALVAAAPTDVSEVDRAGAELEPTQTSSFSLNTRKTHVVQALATVGLQDLGVRPVGALSGG